MPAAGREARTPFEEAVTVQAVGPGRYRAVIDGSWDGPAAPNGGVLTAIMVRAAQAELGADAPPPRTISTQFLEAAGHGQVEVEVEILRRGKRVAVCDVRMRAADRLVAQMTLVCSAPRVQETTLTRTPLQAPPPASVAVVDVERAAGGPPLFSRLETRPAIGSPVFGGAHEAVTGGWVALRDDPAPLDAARLCALCDLWWPAIFSHLTAPAGAPTLQLTIYLRSTQPDVSGPILARFETRQLQEGHIEERGELWSSDGMLLAESQQLALLVPL